MDDEGVELPPPSPQATRPPSVSSPVPSAPAASSATPSPAAPPAKKPALAPVRYFLLSLPLLSPFSVLSHHIPQASAPPAGITLPPNLIPALAKPAAKPSAPPTAFPEDLIRRLMDFGYSREEVVRALQAARGNPDLAASFLFGGGF
jgi:hypothetical protein